MGLFDAMLPPFSRRRLHSPPLSGLSVDRSSPVVGCQSLPPGGRHLPSVVVETQAARHAQPYHDPWYHLPSYYKLTFNSNRIRRTCIGNKLPVSIVATDTGIDHFKKVINGDNLVP